MPKPFRPRCPRENTLLTKEQLNALEKAKDEKEAHGEIETEYPGYLGAQDTFYAGTLKGVGRIRIYQQKFTDPYAKVAFVKLDGRKNVLVAADLLNDRILPFYTEHGISLLRVLTEWATNTAGTGNIMNIDFSWRWRT